MKSQAVLPREVREALAEQPGDALRYRITDEGVLIDKAPADTDVPFAAFTEGAAPRTTMPTATSGRLRP